jgi:C4-dicarboxylate transporter DctM subunit
MSTSETAIPQVATGNLRTLSLSAIQFLSAAAIVLLMGHVLLNVFMRYGFNMPVRGTNEIVAAWYMPIIAFSGFILAQFFDRHISANILFDHLPFRVQREVAVGGILICMLACGLFAYFTLEEALHSMAITRRVITGSQSLIVWPATFAAPIAFAAIAGMLALSAWRTATGQTTISNNDPEAALAGVQVAAKTRNPTREWIARGLILAVLGGSIYLIFTLDSRQEIAGAALVAMLALLFLKVPVAFALAIPGLMGLYAVRPRAVFTMLKAEPYEAVAQWTFSVLPMFVFMGLLLWKSGLTTRIYVAARHWLSWMPGGLAVSTNVAGTGLAAVSGSTIATTYALTRIGVPEMLRAGYDKRLAIGSVMVSGLPGQLIPPSTFLIIYAGIAEVPIGPQLMAGILPGLMVAVVFSLAMVILALVMPSIVGRGKNATGADQDVPDSTWPDRWSSLAAIWPLPVLIGIVLGGMYSGVLTATEAGSAGAFGALLVTVMMMGKKSMGAILDAAMETVIVTGSIFLLIIGAEILSSMLTLSGLADGFATWISSAGFDRVQFLLIVMVAYLVLGMFMDPLPILLLTVPLLIPILNSMEISLLWFGVFAVFMGELGILTPPVGILSFIIHNLMQEKSVSLGQKVSLGDVFMAVAGFMPIAILVAIILIMFPELATWLPDSMSAR